MPAESVGEVAHLFTADHPPRTDSPTYKAARKVLMNTRRGGCMVCGGIPDMTHPEITSVADPHGLQDHHGGGVYVKDVLVALNLFGTEWSLGFSADPAKVQQLVANLNVVLAALGEPTYDAPITDTASVMAYVDSTYNANVKLCLVGEAPVLMHDGSSKALADVEIGDIVFGHDCAPHEVVDAWSKPWSGSLVVVDGVAMTPEHPVLTPRGWVRAEELTLGISVLRPHVLGVARVEPQVLEAVVVADAIDVVDGLAGQQLAPESLLHDVAVLHDDALASVLPYADATVACGGHSLEAVKSLAGDLLQRVHAGLVADRGDLALLRARRVVAGVAGSDQEAPSADLALLDDATPRGTLATVGASWSPIRKLDRRDFSGSVHDITVSGSHSFMLAGERGMAVHNCAPHHVGRMDRPTKDANGNEAVGIHEIPFPIWLGQMTCQWDRWDMWAGTPGTLAVAPNPDGGALVLHAHPVHHPGLDRGTVLAPDHPHAQAARRVA